MNERLRNALSDAAYASATARIATEAPPQFSADEWIELRAASAVTQAHGGHPMPSVYAFLTDVSEYPASTSAAPPDLRDRLLFAYAFIAASGAAATAHADALDAHKA
jgi:hypothetical protein